MLSKSPRDSLKEVHTGSQSLADHTDTEYVLNNKRFLLNHSNGGNRQTLHDHPISTSCWAAMTAYQPRSITSATKSFWIWMPIEQEVLRREVGF
jgi:hypothetical protein